MSARKAGKALPSILQRAVAQPASFSPSFPPRLRVYEVRTWLPSSRNDILHHFAEHIRQPEIAAGITISQPGMVDAELIQQCRMQIVNRHPILDGLETELVGRAVSQPALETAARHPHRIAVRIV